MGRRHSHSCRYQSFYRLRCHGLRELLEIAEDPFAGSRVAIVPHDQAARQWDEIRLRGPVDR
ncbi:hypothetical protein GCM10011504_58520 [Siccirubricoccus deserti]|nr:hypothetical protein GCM10011504_58520 [Siccirubricoccus deserti]